MSLQNIERPDRTGPDETSPVGVALRIWNLGKLENGALGKEIGMIFNKETTAMGRIHVCTLM